MMRASATGLALVLVLAWVSTQTLVTPGGARFDRKARQTRGPLNPGFAEQWRAMKTNRLNPLGPAQRRQILDAARAQVGKTTASNLFSIQEIGPYNVGGRTRALRVDLADANHLVAGGVSGGLWHSPDKGQTWIPVNDQATTLAVTDVCQDPFNTDVWYYCTGEPVGNSADIEGQGVFKSTDGGWTWTQLPATAGTNNFNYGWTIQHSLADSHTVFVGTDGDGLMRSTDGGQTWSQVLPTFGHVTDLALLPDGTALATLRGVGIYRSTAGGASGTWTKMTTGLPTSGFRRIQLAFCETQPNLVFAAFEDQLASTYDSGLKGIWKSTDGGVTWAALATNPDTDYGIYFRFPWYAFLFEVHPTDPNFIVVGSVDLAYTRNGGQSWFQASYSHADYHIARFDPADNNRLYVGNDGGIHLYTKSGIGNTSTSLNNGYNVTQYYTGAVFPATNWTYGGTQDNGTNAWQSSSSFGEVFGGDGSFCAVNAQNPNEAFVSYQEGQIFRTISAWQLSPNFSYFVGNLDDDDNGEIDDPVWFINPFDVNPANGSQVYFVTKNRLWRAQTVAQWTPIVADDVADYYAVGISNLADPTVYLGGGGMSLIVKPNAATTGPGNEFSLFGTIPAQLGGSFISAITVNPQDETSITLCLSDYSLEPRVWKLAFANTPTPVWIDISGNLPVGLPVNCLAHDPNDYENRIFAGTDAGVYSTVDAGLTWVREDGFPNVPVMAIKTRSFDRKLLVFTHGRGLWSANLDAPSQSSLVLPVNAQLQVFPNPATAVLNARLELAQPAQAVVRNLKGQRVRTATFSPGTTHRLDVQGLPAGAYFLEVPYQKGVLRQRFIKL